jgi:spore coat polysaccharide biosynthesis predicted glycosyltransferase SpsG
MVKCVAFRVDFNEIIGYGHVFRVVNLAKHLLKKKIKIILITRSIKKIKHIEKNIDKRFIIEQTKNNYKSIVTILNKYNCTTLISDISSQHNLKKKNFFLRYNKFFRSKNIKTISFDDPGQLCSSDLSIVPYACKSIKIKRLKKTKVLKGIEYSIMPIIHKKFLKNKLKNIAKNILILINGTANKNLIKKILLSINKIKYKKMVVKVFIGDTNKKKFSEILKQDKNNKIILFNKFKNVLDLLSWSDIAIVGEGLIKYEVVAARTPGFFINNIISKSNFKKKLNQDFNDLNVLNFLDRSNFKDLKRVSEIFAKYIQSKKKRLLNFKNSKKIKFNQSLKTIQEYIK